MSAFHGPQRKGASRERRDRKRMQADVRNALTKPERRSTKRKDAA